MDQSVAEEWRPIPSWEGFYSASNLGRVRSEPRVIYRKCVGNVQVKQLILMPKINKKGYAVLTLRKRNSVNEQVIVKHYTVARLVALTFIGPKPPGLIVRHGPNGVTDNSVYNLSYGTYKENNDNDRRRDGKLPMGEAHYKTNLTENDVKYIRSSNKKGVELAKEFNVSVSSISVIRKFKSWRHVV
jgi:hypothetical protein